MHDLLDARPDELWVIQINPTARADEPKTVLDITDRRNELSGNLSLYQELHGIEVIDRLLAEGLLVGDRYKHVTVRILEFSRPLSSRLLGPASKLNRDARFIRELMAQGEQQAEEFLAMLAFEQAWRRPGRRRRARDPGPGRRADLRPHRSGPATACAASTPAPRSPSCAPRYGWTSPASSSPASGRRGRSGSDGEADRSAGWRPRSWTAS